jgi:hypothetical protein
MELVKNLSLTHHVFWVMFQLHVQLYVVDLIVIAHETQFFYKSKLLHWTRFRFIGSNRLRLK